MSRIAYINGRFVPQSGAMVPMEDRGYQFADGVYEVIALYDGRLLDVRGHLARLERSLKELGIRAPVAQAALWPLIRELIRRNRRRNGLIYIQVTRGVAPRNHLSQPDRAMLSLSLNPINFPDEVQRSQGVAVITTQDQRWARCDIKSIALLPNVLARRHAAQQQAREAWQVNAAGFITEGALSNAYIIKQGTLITHPADHAILAGITRDVVLRIAREAGIGVEERPFTPEEAADADEAFMTSASSFVLPVTQLNDKPLGDGTCGPLTRQLMSGYDKHIHTHERIA